VTERAGTARRAGEHEVHKARSEAESVITTAVERVQGAAKSAVRGQKSAAPAKRAYVRKTIVAKAPAKRAYVRKATVAKAPAKRAPARTLPAKATKSVAKKAPATKKSVVKKAPAKKATALKAPARATKVPAKKATGARKS
jgi:hypothetical protein